MKNITVKFNSGVEIDLTVFSGEVSPEERGLLAVNAPVYRFVEGTSEDMVVSSTGVVLRRYPVSNRWHLGLKRDYYEVVKPCINKSGYNQINTPTGTTLVHRLVAKTFLGNSSLEIDHINGNKQNNSISNLRYVTHEENCNNDNTKKKNSKLHFYRDIVAINRVTGDKYTFKNLTEAYKVLGENRKGWRDRVGKCIIRNGGLAYNHFWYGKF